MHIPTGGEVVVESFSSYRVVYTWLGTAANDALSKMLSREIREGCWAGGRGEDHPLCHNSRGRNGPFRPGRRYWKGWRP